MSLSLIDRRIFSRAAASEPTTSAKLSIMAAKAPGLATTTWRITVQPLASRSVSTSTEASAATGAPPSGLGSSSSNWIDSYRGRTTP
jgi:hypothetical protein